MLTDWLCLQVLFTDECRFVREFSLTQRVAMLTIDDEVSNDVSRILITYFNFKTEVNPGQRFAKTEFLIALFLMKRALFD